MSSPRPHDRATTSDGPLPRTTGQGPADARVEEVKRRRVRRSWAIGAMIAGVVALAAGAYAVGNQAGAAQGESASRRQSEVAARGAQVMPFDLDRTTHVFTETPDGGRQTVTADVPGDTDQITLIRGHLRQEQLAFTRGDFKDPATIHGRDMPGIAALQAGARRIRVTYAELPQGGSLTYSTTDAALVAALHAWFRAQLSDHGSHAEAGH